MTCEGCFSANGGVFIAGCRSCTIRAIFRSQEHFLARKAGKLLPAYMALLREVGDPAVVHEEVKAYKEINNDKRQARHVRHDER